MREEIIVGGREEASKKREEEGRKTCGVSSVFVFLVPSSLIKT